MKSEAGDGTRIGLEEKCRRCKRSGGVEGYDGGTDLSHRKYPELLERDVVGEQTSNRNSRKQIQRIEMSTSQ